MLSGGATLSAAGTKLFLFILDFDGFKVFCLENLTAIQTFDVAAVLILRDEAGVFVFAGRSGHGKDPSKSLRTL